MREGFSEIVDGWTLVRDIHALTERIEAAAEWTVANGPLQPDEEKIVEAMIEAQIWLGVETYGI